MEKAKGKRGRRAKSGGRKMTITKARELSSEEYAKLDSEYGGFNSETYNNHQTHDSKETLFDFLEKGAEKIKGIRFLKNAD